MKEIRKFSLNASYSILIALAFFNINACDTFEEELNQKELISLDTYRVLSSESSVLFDLKSEVNVNEEITVELKAYPNEGEVSFLEDGRFLLYRPSLSYTEGKDSFSLLASSESGSNSILSVELEMVSDSTGFPCFSGALGEDYTLGKGESILFNPILNDGFCPEQISSFSLMADQPSNGTSVVSGDYNILYTPNQDFEGVDNLLYHVDFEDLNGVSHESSAVVTFNVVVEECDLDVFMETIWADTTLNLSAPYEPLYTIPIPRAPIACSWPIPNVEIINVSGGQATYNSNLEQIEYVPPINPQSVETIDFEINIGGSIIFQRKATLVFE